MAFASVISLMNTIERLLNSSHISLVPPSPKIIEFAYKELESLQEILKRLDSSSISSNRKKVNALDGQIREVVSEFEGVLESHLSNQIVSQTEGLGVGDESHPMLFSIDLQDLKQDVDSFIKTVKKMEEEYINELHNLPEEEEDEALSSRIGFGGKKSKMVGLSTDLSEIRDMLTFDVDIVTILIGMSGIGKTAVAEEIFEDPLILSYFECRAWVRLGRKYQLNEVAQGIIAQVDPDREKMLMEGDDKIAQYLYESLKGKICLIVLDDVWDTDFWDCLRSSLPDNNNGRIKILFTTRLLQVAEPILRSKLGFLKVMPFLNKNESWDLLCKKVFAKELFPPQLEKAGKKIAENCEGLPLMIVTIGNLLSKAEKTLEYWNKVAEKQNSIFMDAYDEMLKVLYPSYEYLPQHLKPCFLYIGVFPKKFEIPLSKLINMWIVEGFLEPDITQTLEDCAMKCLDELFSNNLIIICQRSTNYRSKFANGIKTCRLHSSFWHLCNKEAEKNKFFHVTNTLTDGSGEGIKGQYRLCIHNNILLGIKDIYNSMEDDCASTVRSLLCFGPYQQYALPICFGLCLLRVLDALNIRFYEFPMEVLKLVQLRYLALTFDGKLPASISQLLNLQFLLIHRHLSIRSCGAPSYVPIEIWDMKELKHIQITGSNLPHPNCVASLTNLSTLLGVSAHSCTKEVLKRVSNLKKLGIQIELVPDDDSEPFDCLNYIFLLNKLESLKCIIVNPELMSEIVAPPPPLSMFPSSLQKLHLSGLGYPWEYMSLIASLPNLLVLKLQYYAFRGPKWEIEENKFVRLHFLQIEDTDLVQWKVGCGSIPTLKILSIKHCYNLQELHWGSDRFPFEIEIVDCNPLTVTCVKQIKEAPYVKEQSSWDDGGLPASSNGSGEWVFREL